ncbi:hypothetical protein D3C73_1479210 [compost metagenome]
MLNALFQGESELIRKTGDLGAPEHVVTLRNCFWRYCIDEIDDATSIIQVIHVVTQKYGLMVRQHALWL